MISDTPSEKALQALLGVKEIPPPAGMAGETLRIMGSDSVSLHEVVDLIEKSPELTARILRCANSAYYGQRRHIATVEEAVIRVLGLTITRSLILAMALANPFQIKNCPSFDSEQHWFVAITTARLARNLAVHQMDNSLPLPQIVYTAGLIHNLGILALVHRFPEKMDAAFRDNSHESTTASIVFRVGIDHQAAGAWLAQSWGLPEQLVLVLAHHRETGYHGPEAHLINLVGLAAQAATGMYHQQSPSSAEAEDTLKALGLGTDTLQREFEGLSSQLDSLKDLAKLFSGSSKSS